MKQWSYKHWVAAATVFLISMMADAQQEVSMVGVKQQRMSLDGEVTLVRQYDPQGRMVFEKCKYPYRGIRVTTRSYEGQDTVSKRTVECFVSGNSMEVAKLWIDGNTRWKAVPDGEALWEAESPHYAEQNSAVSMQGFPADAEQWLEHPPLQTILALESVKRQEEKLDSHGRVLEHYELDRSGEIDRETYSVYDGQGRLLRFLNSVSDYQGRPTMTHFRYDSLGNKVGEAEWILEMEETDSGWIDVTGRYRGIDTVRRVVAAYQDGRIVTHRETIKKKAILQQTWTYDLQGNPVEIVLKDLLTGITLRRKLHHDGRGRPVEERFEVVKPGKPTEKGLHTWDYQYW